MKTRILFLDDEPLALQGLQRMLRNMREGWEMTFAESGRQALDQMAQSPFDVVVSDMLMAGMNGAQFLAEVKIRHPHTVRLILSGHADRELILGCLKSAHQILSKPCQPDILKATVTQMSALHSTLPNEDVRQTVTRMNSVPSVPALYIELADKLREPETSVEEAATIVTQDVGMTAKVLQLMNSGFFGTRKPASSATDAVLNLGLDNLRALLSSGGAFSPLASAGFGESSLEALWKHSLETALAARTIALLEHADKKLAEEAFTAGLLHDVGKAVLGSHSASGCAEAARLASQRNLELWAAEAHVFAVSHAEVGGYLLGLWGLPASLVEAVSLHHRPSQSATRRFTSLTAVHVANALIRDFSGSPNEVPPAVIDFEYLEALGLAARLDCWREAVREHFSVSACS